MLETATLDKPKFEVIKPFRAGDLVEGTVIGIGRSCVYLNLGPQGTGIIYGREFLEEKTALKEVKQGERVVAKIVELENDDGYVELSLRQAGKELTWDRLKEKKEKEEILKVKIVGANKGGLLADLYGTQAFLPVSQLAQEHYPRVEDGDSSKILRALQAFMGQELEVQIFDLDPREGKIILSERSKERAKVREQLAKFQVGDVIEGEITGVVDFGAFIRFPINDSGTEPIEGLIHISEIDWQIIEDPSQVLKVGDKVKAKIVDLSQGRASLSLKALKEDPWKEVEKRHNKLDVVQGKVTKLNPFGAFVEIEEKIQGLCHISEFGTKSKMEETLKPGETYPFQILELNPAEHRMSLRLATGNEANTAATAEPQQPKEEQPGTSV
ncbi:MAG TPA: S1 RNA-binding domain-containing protein [Candidatus Paceibacterota bacterium]